MCGRFTLARTDQLPLRFDIVAEDSPVEPRYNIAPSQEIPAVVEQPEGRHLQRMR